MGNGTAGASRRRQPSGLELVAAASALPGRDLPGAQLSNDRLAELMQEAATRLRRAGVLRPVPISSPDFPFERLGIVSRPVLDHTLTARDLALCAGRKAVQQADVDPARICAVIVATVSGDMPYPAIATTLHAELGLSPSAMAFDLTLGCSGSLVALQAATQRLAGEPLGSAALVVGTETLVRTLDATDRATCTIFGDGAGALVVQRTEEGDLAPVQTWTDGRAGPLISRPNAPVAEGPMLRFRARGGALEVVEDQASRARVQLRGQRVFRDMIRQVPSSIVGHLAAQGMAAEDVDLFLLHQANARMLAGIGSNRFLDIQPARMPNRIADTGNLASASVPILLAGCAQEGLVRPGSKLVLCSFGSGYSLGITSLTWRRATVTQTTGPDASASAVERVPMP